LRYYGGFAFFDLFYFENGVSASTHGENADILWLYNCMDNFWGVW